ncbi:MAG: hypothetical protein JXB85_13590 [Anaerolineales bacterium]|nr:hypothetical protein [Anaerolineales bacterium]
MNAAGFVQQTWTVGQAEGFRIVSAPENSSERCFHAVGQSQFDLDLRDLSPGEPLGDWLCEPHWQWSIGAVDVPDLVALPGLINSRTPLVGTVDQLPFIDEPTPSEFLP